MQCLLSIIQTPICTVPILFCSFRPCNLLLSSRHSNCNASISRMTLWCSATSNSIYLPIRVGTCSGAAPGYRLQPGDGCGVLTLVCPHQSCLAQPPTDSESVYSQSQHPPFEMQRLHSTRCHVAFSQYRCQVSLRQRRKYVTCEACLVLVMFTVKVVFNIRLIAESTHDE